MDRTPIPTLKTDGLRMLKCIRDSGVVEPLEAKLGQAPGPRSSVTVPMLLLGTLLCGLRVRQRRADLPLVLAGLHNEVASEVGLLDSDGNRVPCQPAAVLRQTLRMEKALSDGWTVEENDESVAYDLQWFSQSLIRASVPADVWAQVRHVAVGAVAVPAARSDPDARPGIRGAGCRGGQASLFLGYDLHTLMAAPAVRANGRHRKFTMKNLLPLIVTMDLRPATVDSGPVAERLVLDAREVCPNIGDVTAAAMSAGRDAVANAHAMLEENPTVLNRRVGLTANTIAVLARVVAYNLRLADR